MTFDKNFMQKRNYFYVLPSFYYNVAKFYIPVTFKWLPNAVFIISDISNWNISKECCFFCLLRISKLFIYDIFDFSNSRICAKLLIYDYKSKLHKSAVYKKRTVQKAFSPFSVFSLFQINMTWKANFMKKHII